MSPAPQVVVGLDIGTTKICALIGEVTGDEQVEVIGVGIVPARGMRKGVAVNTEEVVAAIGTAVRRAEQQSGFRIVSAFVGISGAHISTVNSQGVVAVRSADRQISADDVQRAIDAARVVNMPADREVIQVLARHYVVDGQEGIKNPVGMLGHRIEVETTVVSGSMTSVSNLARCVDRAGIGLDSLVLQPLAAGHAVLTEAERDLGVAVIDIGGGTTDVAAFVDGSLAYASVLPVGGFQVSNDVSVGLRAPFPVAEEIKIRHGYAIASLIEDDRPIDVSSFDGLGGEAVTRRTVGEIIEPRMEETLELAREALARAGFASPPAGVVLCGGTAQLGGVRRLAQEVFRTSVRIGTPTGVAGLTDQIMTPAFAASVGLLRWGMEEAYDGTEESGSTRPLAGVGNAIVGWLKNFLP